VLLFGFLEIVLVLGAVDVLFALGGRLGRVALVADCATDTFASGTKGEVGDAAGWLGGAGLRSDNSAGALFAAPIFVSYSLW
jgi:hypothetical protein